MTFSGNALYAYSSYEGVYEWTGDDWVRVSAFGPGERKEIWTLTSDGTTLIAGTHEEGVWIFDL
jgi:hypothetical protein